MVLSRGTFLALASGVLIPKSTLSAVSAGFSSEATGRTDRAEALTEATATRAMANRARCAVFALDLSFLVLIRPRCTRKALCTRLDLAQTALYARPRVRAIVTATSKRPSTALLARVANFTETRHAWPAPFSVGALGAVKCVASQLPHVAKVTDRAAVAEHCRRFLLVFALWAIFALGPALLILKFTGGTRLALQTCAVSIATRCTNLAKARVGPSALLASSHSAGLAPFANILLRLILKVPGMAALAL